MLHSDLLLFGPRIVIPALEILSKIHDGLQGIQQMLPSS